MIPRTPSTSQFFQTSYRSAVGPPFRTRRGSDDGTARIARQIEALQRNSYEIPRALSAGPEEIRWIG